MYFKHLIGLMLLAFLFAGNVNAQFVSVKGRVVDQDSKSPVYQVSVSLDGEETAKVESDKDGKFVLENVKQGQYNITVSKTGFVPQTFRKVIGKAGLDFGTIVLLPASTAVKNSLADMAVSDLEVDNDMEVQEVATLLNSSKDVYSNIASYTFSPMRFKARGYDSEYSDIYLNGIQMNDMISGYGVWSLWGGLNDATRNQENSLGLETASYAFGNLGGVGNIVTRASGYRPGVKVSYSNSNRTYNNRVMATYSTGVLNNGWSMTVSGSRRWGDNGYVKGVFYDAWGYFLGVEKKINNRHSLAFTALASPTERGVAAGATQEAYDLTGNNFYNSNVGYQNGKLRNARVRDNFEPIFALNHYWEVNDKTQLTTSVGYRFGRNGYSALNWHDGQDPRPDYYRNLPSYYAEIMNPSDPKMAAIMEEKWRTEPSTRYIDFDGLYNVNYNNQDIIRNDKGEIVASGLRSNYMIEDRRTDQKQLNVSILLNRELSENITLNGGLKYRWNKTANFKTVKDLLGGEYFYDIDKFADRDFAEDPDKGQSDLRNKYRVVREGDRFGYDYDAHIQDAGLWAAAAFNYNKVDFSVALDGSYTSFYRYGNYQKGLFPDNSFGKSKTQNFFNYGIKAGATYKLTGRHYFNVNLAYLQKAPYFRDAYISPRTRDGVIDGLKEENIFSGDLSYILRAPRLKGRVTGFYTKFTDQTRTMSFWDESYNSFGNYIMTGIDRTHLGVEVGLEAKITSTLTAQGAFTYGDYKYTSTPMYSQVVDNTAKELASGKVYWKDYKVSGTPQTAASIGLTYNAPQYWFVGVNGNYFGRSYIDINPVLRTDRGIEQLEEYQPQEEFKDGFTLDAFAGASFRIAYKYYLGINLSVSNLLNTKDMKSGGFEQLRVSYDKDTEKLVRPYDSKYFYMYGANYFLNVNFRF